MQTGVGFRNVGFCIKNIHITTADQPDGILGKGDFYLKFQQLNIPIIFTYSFGKKIEFRPMLGFVNNYNLSLTEYYVLNGKKETTSDERTMTFYKKYVPNGLIGFDILKQNIANSKFGISLKFAFEHSLGNVFKVNRGSIYQSIFYGNIGLSYQISKKK